MVNWRDARFLILTLVLIGGVLLAYAAAIYDFNFDLIYNLIWPF